MTQNCDARTYGRSWSFSHAIVRAPGRSVVAGLRSGTGDDPDPGAFLVEHKSYVDALQATGATIVRLEPLEAFADSVFVEDPVLCLGNTAILLRPGAASRLAEADAIRPDLETLFGSVLSLPGSGFVDGGDLLATDTELFAGLSARTNEAGLDALAPMVESLGYRMRRVSTPAEILHFKTDCGLLDSETIFASAALADTGCFEGYRVVIAPGGEAAAANLIRFNSSVFINEGYPQTRTLLQESGYQVVALPAYEAAKIDGGLSCMSLRFSL